MRVQALKTDTSKQLHGTSAHATLRDIQPHRAGARVLLESLRKSHRALRCDFRVEQ